MGESGMTFEEYWGEDRNPGKITAKHAWNAGQAAERERIKRIVDEVGVQGNHDEWFDCCDTIMERLKNEN
jgi:hypothetical protein